MQILYPVFINNQIIDIKRKGMRYWLNEKETIGTCTVPGNSRDSYRLYKREEGAAVFGQLPN